MICVLLQGFAMLLAAFLIGLPLGDCLAGWLRRWMNRVKTDRMLTVAVAGRPVSATATPNMLNPPAQDNLPWSESVAYPPSAFGSTVVTLPVRKDHEVTFAIPPADMPISRSLRPPAR